MSEDINVTDGTVLECLNNKVDLDGGNYVGSPLEQYIHEHCGGGGGGGAFELFDTKLSDHILSYKETRGWALQGSYVYSTAVAGERYGYPDFVNKCIEEKEAGVATQVTLGTSTITMYINSNGHQFYDIADKGVVDYWFNTYGIADFYGVDTENKCVFLPRNIYFMQLTNDITKVNDMNQAKLPGITTTTTTNVKVTVPYNGWTVSGAQAETATKGTLLAAAGANEKSETLESITIASANRAATVTQGATSTSKYNDNTVQPPSSNKLLYYCVGNTVTDLSWIEPVSQVEAGVKDLEDKTLEGIERLKQSSTALTQTQITNCITEIPQRIKYTIENGTLTIKAGTVSIFAYGTEDKTSEFPVGVTFINENWKVVDTQYTEDSEGNGKFFVWVELQQDVIGSTGSLGEFFITVVSQGDNINFTGNTSSGDNLTPVSYSLQYDTTTNYVKRYGSDTTVGQVSSLPIMKVTVGASNYTDSVNQVFNGTGYLGSTVWVDKGVKGLASNGKNKDGSYKNVEITTDKLLLGNTSGNGNGTYKFFILNNSLASIRPAGEGKVNPVTVGDKYSWIFYNTELSKWFFTNGDTTPSWSEIIILELGNIIGKTITSFNPKQPFRAVDYQDIDGIYTHKNEIALVASPETLTVAVNVIVDYDISEHIPNDDNSYLVATYLTVQAGATTSAYCHVWTTDSRNTGGVSCGGNTTAAVKQTFVARGWTLVGPDRILRTHRSCSTAAGILYSLGIGSYRKVR